MTGAFFSTRSRRPETFGVIMNAMKGDAMKDETKVLITLILAMTVISVALIVGVTSYRIAALQTTGAK